MKLVFETNFPILSDFAVLHCCVAEIGRQPCARRGKTVSTLHPGVLVRVALATYFVRA